MSLGASLANALTGLNAASRMAEVVSSNLANALTEGYGRRVVNLSSMDLGGRGAGVRVDGITRVVDRGLLSDRQRADAALSRDSRLAEAGLQLEQIVGTADSADSLAGRMRRLEASLVAASSDPSAGVRLDDVVRSLKSVAQGFNEQSVAVQKMRTDAEAAIAEEVGALNARLGQIAKLNTDIQAALGRREDATALMDARQSLVDDVSSIVPVRTFDRANGQIALVSTSGTILLDGKPADVTFAQSAVVTADMTYGNGLLSGLQVNGHPISASDGFSKLGGGSLGAAFQLRDQILPAQSARLDEMAADLISRFESTGVDPTWGPGMTGLFTDNGAAFDPLTLTGLAGRIGVNAGVDPDQGGAAWRLREGVHATVQGPVGNGAQIDAWSNALGAKTTLLSGGVARGAAGHATDLVTLVSGARLAAEETRSFSAARQGTLKGAELAMGVDSDAEMQTLLLVEQAYAANAKVIATIDGLMQTLLEI